MIFLVLLYFTGFFHWLGEALAEFEEWLIKALSVLAICLGLYFFGLDLIQLALVILTAFFSFCVAVFFGFWGFVVAEWKLFLSFITTMAVIWLVKFYFLRKKTDLCEKVLPLQTCLIVFGALLAVQSAIAESNDFYALVSFSKGTGSQVEGYDDNRSWDSTRAGNFSGIAVGYRFPVSDRLWGGIEFSHLTGEARSDYPDYSENWAEGITDLTGQLGVRSNAYFFYGSVSISRFEVVPRTKSLGNADLNTHGLGLGVEKMLADGYFIGVNYKSRFRDKSNYPNTLLGRKYWTENSIDTLGLRFGKHF